MAKFAYTILYVKDVTRAVAFYENAFDFKRKFISPDNDYAELITGQTVLSFASVELAKTNLPGGFIENNSETKPFGIEIGFVVDDVENSLKVAMAAGALLVSEPKIKPWGQTVAYVRDPEGFLIEICTSMGE